MRFFRLKHNFNWKYVIGEILLIFVGINLAIWFNNWNTSKKSDRDKKIVMTKITEEIRNNMEELSAARKSNQLITQAFSAYQKFFKGSSSEIIASPGELHTLQTKYPNFFRVKDSVAYQNGLFHYHGGTFINLEIPELTEIAWETARTINIANEFDYECLYDLESMYNLQQMVKKEVNKAADALQKRELRNLMSILEFMNQLDLQLLKKYEEMLENMQNCR